MTAPAPRILVTGLYDLRGVVLALPRLCALRARYPEHHITVIAPPAARDLLLRLRVADAVRALTRRALGVMVWVVWQKIRRSFAMVADIRDLHEVAAPPWQRLARDLSFVLPAQNFVALSLIDSWPTVRMAALIRKLGVAGYACVLLGVQASPAQAALVKAVPELIDLTGRLDLADIPEVAQRAAVTVGGCDAMVTLAALSGARALLVSAGRDDAVEVLPHANTTWIECDDVAQLSVGDIMKAV